MTGLKLDVVSLLWRQQHRRAVVREAKPQNGINLAGGRLEDSKACRLLV